LGLRVPCQDANNGDRQADDKTGCWIKVADEKRRWENGKAIVFDTSFTHSTGNFTDDERLVLIIDFWHPDLSEKERRALEFVYDARNKFESGQAKEIDASWVKDGRPLTVDAYLKKNTNSLTGFMNNFTNKFF
jgi:aspartyl/asparaginyl beta-hydroxylase (cupin superfamily)